MADNNRKPRTNWSDKARRITGAVTFLVVVAAIALAVLLPRGKNDAQPTVTAAPAPVASVQETKPQETKAPETTTVAVAEVKTEPSSVETSKTTVEAVVAEPVVEEAKTVESVTASETAPAAVEPAVEEVAVAPEAAEAETSEIKAEEVEAAVEVAEVKVEAVEAEAEIAEVKSESSEPKTEEVEAVAASEAETPVADTEEEDGIETASFDIFGHTVENAWGAGLFLSVTAEEGLVTEDEIAAFAEYEAAKYGSFLTDNVMVGVLPSTLMILYPETLDVAPYIDYYKADIEEYILLLLESSVAEEALAANVGIIGGADGETEIYVEDVSKMSFSVFGIRVDNTWTGTTFTSTNEYKGFLTEDDVRGFALYEVGKYGSFLSDNVAIAFVDDGFTLSYPEGIDPEMYIDDYRADIVEYVYTLTAKAESVAEEVMKAEEKAEEIAVTESAKVEETAATEVTAETATAEAATEVATAPAAPETPTSVDVPAPVESVMVSAVTEEVKSEEVEVVSEPKASKKLKSFDVSLGFGADFGFKSGRSYTTLFPSLDITGEFRNIVSAGAFELGLRLDIESTFRPIGGTFMGHSFDYFLDGNNWGMDGTVGGKLMFSANLGSSRYYLGLGAGYSLASNLSEITSHQGSLLFGFKTSVVASGVVGAQWMLGDTFFLSLEGQGRYHLDSKEYAVVGAMRMGWSF